MQGDLFILSDDDRERLERLIKDEESRTRKIITLRVERPEPYGEYSYVYAIRTPPDGIPYMWGPAGTGTGSWKDLAGTGTGTTVEGENCRPGNADCELFRLRTVDAYGRPYTRPRLESTGSFVTVSNPSFTAVPGNKIRIVKRDSAGVWWIDTTTGGSNINPVVDTTFLAVLTAKQYTDGEFIAYSWIAVLDDITPHPVSYTPEVASGSPGSFPAYHLRNLDIPISSDSIPGTGTGTGSNPEPLSVVRLWKGTGNYYLFNTDPWEDLFRRTGVTDADGEVAYHRFWNQNTNAWEDGREVRLIQAE